MHTVILSDLVKTLLASGHHPSAIRTQLAARGIRWAYKFDGANRGGGKREKVRRLKQMGLQPCAMGCGANIPIDVEHGICYVCLAKKWAVNP